MALPTALLAMIVSFGFAGAAVLSTVNAQQGTKGDRDSKNAIAAADAGASVALLRLNRFQSGLTEATPCIGPGGESQEPTGGWCPATSPESVGGATFSYTVSAFQEDVPLTVVAVGASGGDGRRIEVGLISYGDEKVFTGEKFIGESEITLEGTPEILTDIGTNGNVDSDGNGTICGDIRTGIGKEAPDPDCGGEVTEANKTLPPVALPDGIETNNWNCRLSKTISTNCPTENDYDPYIGANGKEKRTSTAPWDAETRTINISGNSTLTMGGRDYFVCGLFIENGQLIMPAGSTVRVFFDTPENCGLKDGAVQLRVTGSAHIVSTAYNSGESNEVPGFYLLGSPTIETKVELNGTSGGTNELMLYAPNSDITISGNATWIGMAAGNTLRTNGTPTIEADTDIPLPALSFAGLWERTHYVECTGASASPPDASC